MITVSSLQKTIAETETKLVSLTNEKEKQEVQKSLDSLKRKLSKLQTMHNRMLVMPK